VDHLVIREAKIADKVALLQIEEMSFPHEHLHRIQPRQMRYLLTKAQAKTWVAEKNGVVVAYAMVFLPVKRRVSRLYSLAVMPTYRGQGIARMLMQVVLETNIVAHFCCMRLEARASEHSLIAFYQSLGFTIVSSKVSYYEDGEDACCMQRISGFL